MAIQPRRLVGKRSGPRQTIIVRAGDIQRDEDDLPLAPDRVLDKLTIFGMRSGRSGGLAQQRHGIRAEALAGRGEEKASYCGKLVKRRSARALLCLVTIGPLIVAGRVDHRIGKLLEDVVDAGVPCGNGFRRQRVQSRAGARHAAGVNIADVDHQAYVRIAVDRADEQRSFLEQSRAVRPVTECSERETVRTVSVGRERGKRKSEQQGENRKPSGHLASFCPSR